jgi:hypothetical protein
MRSQDFILKPSGSDAFKEETAKVLFSGVDETIGGALRARIRALAHGNDGAERIRPFPVEQ